MVHANMDLARLEEYGPRPSILEVQMVTWTLYSGYGGAWSKVNSSLTILKPLPAKNQVQPPPPPPTPPHTHTHTVHMALMGYFIVFSFVTKTGQTLEFLLWGTIVPLNFLAGYYCSIVASTHNLRCTRSHWHTPHTVLFTYTVWTFVCSRRVLKKVKFFKPLPFPLKIVFGRISSQSFLLIFSSILRQITTYQNSTFLRKLRISNSWKHCVDVCKSTQCFKFLHCVDIFCSQVHTSYVTQKHTHVQPRHVRPSWPMQLCTVQSQHFVTLLTLLVPLLGSYRLGLPEVMDVAAHLCAIPSRFSIALYYSHWSMETGRVLPQGHCLLTLLGQVTGKLASAKTLAQQDSFNLSFPIEEIVYL